ncbi:MAG: signal peptidase I [Nitriliruptoraceae bacterium]|nr:signal peptidase I [Nitriliruptoraceae bacterium]
MSDEPHEGNRPADGDDCEVDDAATSEGSTDRSPGPALDEPLFPGPPREGFRAREPVGDDGAASSQTSSAGEQDASRGRTRRSSGSSFLRELPVLLLIAFVLAFLLRTFLLQVFYIPSGSMQPTLDIDDRMVVEKVTYRFGDPERGDIAVFEGESLGDLVGDVTPGERFVRGVGQFLGLVPASARDYVKRVVGLPGDEILIEDGVVFVNGTALDEPYVVFQDPSDFGPVTVPDGQLFFLGDNRPNSADSRRQLGYVPIDDVVGRAAFIIWPLDNAGSLMGTSYDLDEATSAPDGEPDG